MEGGKRAEEAGPSSGCSSVQIGEEEKHQKKEAAETEIIMSDERAFDVEDDDDQEYEEDLLDNFVPAPPIPLKDQLDKDKVRFFFSCSCFFLKILYFFSL